MKFRLLILTWNEVWRLAILKTILRKKNKKKRNNNKNNNSKPQQKSPQQTDSEPNCAVVRVLLAAKERASSAPYMTWACAWCPVSRNITQK